MSWIKDIQGLTTVLDENDDPVQRRSVISFEGATVADDGTKTVVTFDGGSGGTISGRLLRYTEYTSGSGTHVFLANSRTRIAHLQGAGAGAGGVTNAATSVKASAGGQAGGWKEIVETGVPTGTGVYAIGAAGVGGNGTTPTNGTDGGNTTLGMNGGTQTATGGVGSDTVTSGGAVAVNLPRNQSANAGDTAGPGLMLSTTVGVSGRGGASRYGRGGEAKQGAGSSGVGAGSGGSGAVATGGAPFNGGSGTLGLIRIWEFS